MYTHQKKIFEKQKLESYFRTVFIVDADDDYNNDDLM